MSSVNNPYYTYQRLPPNHIRLLSIQPTLNDDTESIVELGMEVYSLDQLPKFNALSYTWGPATFAQEEDRLIFTQEPRCYPFPCNGKLLRGTHNLRDALRAIRDARVPEMADYLRKLFNTETQLLIWVDALCINQDDIEERNDQVAIMARIFQSADFVIAWLGAADEHSRTAMKMIVELNNIALNKPDQAEYPGIRLPSKFSNDEWLDYSLFMKRRWFSRSWILQEVVASKSLLLVCGRLAIIWEVLAGATRYIVNNKWTALLHAKALQYVERNHNVQFDERLQAQTVNDYVRVLTMDYFRREYQQGRYTSLYTTHTTMMSTVCSDPRDKVYAQLSMNGDLKAIRPDYAVDPSTLYVEAYAAALAREGNLKLLHTYQNPERTSKLQGLPTWCLDLNNPRINHPMFMPGDPCPWQADAGMSQPTNSFEVVRNTLHVRAVRVALILESTTFGGVSGINKVLCHVGVLNLLLRLQCPSNKLSFHDQSKFEILWRTLMMNCDSNGKIASPEFGRGACLYYEGLAPLMWELLSSKSNGPVQIHATELQSFISAVRELSHAEKEFPPNFPDPEKLHCFLRQYLQTVSGEDIYSVPRTNDMKAKIIAAAGPGFSEDQIWYTDWCRELLKNSKDRSLFRTDNECLGVASAIHQAGDEVWILEGLDTPCVLRPMPNGQYQFLGDAYVHGIMNGEAVPRDGMSITTINIE